MKIENKFLQLFFLLTAFFLSDVIASGQTPNWMWARSATGTHGDAANSVAVDANGNSFITGYFMSPSINFGSVTLTNSDNSGNTQEMFLVKYDPSGNVLWAKSGGGMDDDAGNSVAVDASGNSYVAGYFQNFSITFDTITLPINGSHDLFIVKYDPSGNLLWAKSAGGIGNDFANNVSVDVSGNIYLTGYFASQSISFGPTTLNNSGGNNMILVKYNSAGNVLWAKNSDADQGLSVSSDASGNSYVAGYFTVSTVTFGSTTLTNAGNEDIFIAKYNASGNIVWAKSVGGIHAERAKSISTDAAGNCYLTGDFHSVTLTFGSSTLTNTDNTGFSSDMFIAKYDSSGNALWAKNGNGSDWDFGNSICNDATGNSFVTGYFQSPTIAFGTSTLTNTGSQNLFLVKYDASGNVVWAKTNVGLGANEANAVAVDANGNSFVAGYFGYPNVIFDFDTLSIIQTMYSDLFIAKSGTVTGINSFENPENDISIFPNPSTGIFTVNISNANYSNAQIIISDVLGKTIYRSEILNSKSEIDLGRNASGIYFYKIINEKGIIGSGKIILQ